MKAYMVLSNIKSLDDDRREIEGLATTPQTDLVGDVVEPTGAKFKLPIPLLLGHDHMKPIGSVTHAKVTKDGISIKAKIAKSDSPGIVKDRLDEAWHSIKLGLVRGLSIGFSSVPGKTQPLKSGGQRFLEWIWHELSAVVIPANEGATITAVKSAARRGVVYARRSVSPVTAEQRKRHPGAVWAGDEPGMARPGKNAVYLRGR